MQRVLVLEHDQETADRLITALRQIDNLSVSLVPTMREACLIVAQTPQDLALVPLEESEQLRLALRAVQPDLNIVLTTADSHLILSNNYRQDYQGLLHTTLLEQELPTILGLDDVEPSIITESKKESRLLPSLARLKEACLEVGINKSTIVQMAILSSAGHLIGYCGGGNEAQAYMVVELLSESWKKEQISAQIQYFQLPDYFDARLIYSRRAASAVLSLVAEPEIPIADVRQTADKLVRLLSSSGSDTAESGRKRTMDNKNGLYDKPMMFQTFAIAWRPVKPLPVILQRVVGGRLADLMDEAGFQQRHLSITAEIIHLVITCPAGKTAAWAAFYLKSGTNEEIQRQFGVKSSIWRKGFYATESEQPLNEAELKMLLTS